MNIFWDIGPLCSVGVEGGVAKPVWLLHIHCARVKAHNGKFVLKFTVHPGVETIQGRKLFKGKLFAEIRYVKSISRVFIIFG